MKKLSLSKLDALFAVIAKTQMLYLPVNNAAGQAEYQRWSEGVVRSTALNTVRSAKDFFFPQTENLVDFKMQGKKIQIVDSRTEAEDFVLFGVRACDARSFAVLDKVFLTEPIDTYYQSRREHGTIVTLACTRPEETCFCTSFGVDPASPEGDVSCWMTEDALYLQANTVKGESLLGSCVSLLEEGEDTPVKAQQEDTKAILERLPLALFTAEKFGGHVLLQAFGSQQWDALSESCLGCGTCTFVCPTCQCYDIRDFDTGHEIKRFRCWDSCMYSEFTKMAHGNPRLTQKERFRQRFMHKLVYFPANNNGEYGCVGCGRCLAKCPVSMNIVKVARALEKELD